LADSHASGGWTAALKQRLSVLRRREDQLALVLSLVIGAAVGLVVVAFILLTGRLAARMYPPGGAGWRRILVPLLGSLASGFLLARYFPFARGSGIPQTKFALFINDGRISFRTVVGKFICCSMSLASGIALGREGPSVQIGAGLASVIGRKLGLSKAQVKALVPVGCSAALAAAFNTPIAAVLFSLEEIMGDLHATVLGTAVLSSATSWMVLHLFLGDSPLFQVAGYKLVHPLEFGIYALLGVLGGFASVAFVKLLLWLRAWFQSLPRNTAWLQPSVGGLAVGVMGYFVPEVMGVGYEYVEKVLNGNVVLQVAVLLVVLKIAATVVCYSSGNAGGIFGPSLFIGSMLGAAVGSVVHHFLPAYTAGPGAYALVGMGALFAGIIRTPFTSVIMIFELTRDYSIIVPLMIANMTAYFISQRFQREPIYEALSRQEGVHLPAGASHRKTIGQTVGDAMDLHPLVLDPAVTVEAALELAGPTSDDVWPVADTDGLHGLVQRAELQGERLRGLGGRTLHDLLSGIPGRYTDGEQEFPHVHPDHPLSAALERMGSTGLRALPVVSRANARRLIGMVVFDEVVKAYGIPRPE
jgi:CIC family chloride channel protein